MKPSTKQPLPRPLPEVASEFGSNLAAPETLLQEFILKIWQKLLGRVDIGVDDDFIGAGGNSRLKLKMILAVEKATRQKIPASSIENISTVRELELAMLRGGNSSREDLVTCAKEGHGTPLLFCHGDYATHGLYVRKLTEMLVCDEPVFLLHPYPNPDPKLTIEEMARAYLPRILEQHPTGGFRLLGYCNGGQLAWEVASQLRRLGRDIEFVVLIETVSINARPIPRAIARLIRLAVSLAPREVGQQLSRNAMSSVWNRISLRQVSTPYTQALQNYIPPKLRTRLISVVCEESRTKNVYSPTPWKNLASQVDCRYISGSHRNNLTTLVGELVPVLNNLLKQPRGDQLP